MNVKLEIKDHLKFLMLAIPRPILRPIISGLWRAGAINRHYFLYSRLNCPDAILQGPFKGMRYLPCSAGSAIVAKYVGTYEKELWNVIETLSVEHDVLIDVGSAEGYYAVGLTMRLNLQRTHCFDVDPRANRLLARIADLNGVREKMVIHQGCSVKELESALSEGAAPLLVMDCEGYEEDYLNPLAVPSLAKAVIIVEVHEKERPGITQRLEERFKKTHAIRRIAGVSRSFQDLPPDTLLDQSDAEFATDERRQGAMEWFVMIPETQQVPERTVPQSTPTVNVKASVSEK